MEKITLVQPRHYQAEEADQNGNISEGHIYMPSSLITAGARILAAGGDVKFEDGNLARLPKLQNKITGANIIGAPLIPEAIKLRNQIQKIYGDDHTFILGGQVINGLTPEQFAKLFGEKAINGNNDEALKKALKLELRKMPSPEETSHIPAYEKLAPADLQKYLEHEFSLYLSQGCKFGCTFCAAKRTMVDPVTHEVTQVTEQYRNLDLVEGDMRYLIQKAQAAGIKEFNIYLSNLDTFQTPDKLHEFARRILTIKRDFPGFEIHMRGLSTVDAFIDCHNDNPQVIRDMIDAGLYSIGFGVDGYTPAIWKKIKKGHNDQSKSIDAIRLTREEYGITPEVFMIIGHVDPKTWKPIETEETLLHALEFTMDMIAKYGAIPRPYMAKNIVPGNSGWKDPRNQAFVDNLINNPQYFQNLDFSALPTPLTHPDHDRVLLERIYRMLMELPGNTTPIIYPISQDISDEMAKIYRRLNLNRWDR